MAMINDNLQYSALILGLQNEYLKSIIKNPGLIDIESKKFFNEIENGCFRTGFVFILYNITVWVQLTWATLVSLSFTGLWII